MIFMTANVNCQAQGHIYFTYVKHSACDHSVYTICTPWLHHPSFSYGTSLVPWLSLGGEKESLVSTVCACTYFPRNLWNSETIVLYLFNHDIITYTYCYIVRTFSDQRWKSFNFLFSCALQLPPMASYF